MRGAGDNSSRVGWRRRQRVGGVVAGERYNPANMRPATCDRDLDGRGSVMMELGTRCLLSGVSGRLGLGAKWAYAGMQRKCVADGRRAGGGASSTSSSAFNVF